MTAERHNNGNASGTSAPGGAADARVSPGRGVSGTGGAGSVFNPPPANRTDLWISLAVFALALAVRVGFLYDMSDCPSFGVPLVDAETYDHRARQLALKGTLHDEFFYQPCLYPTYLAVVYKLTGNSVAAAQVFQAFLGAATCVLTYWLGRRVVGRAGGVIAAGIVSLYGPLLHFEQDLVAAGWAAFFSVALLLLFLRAREKRSAGLCFVVGLCGILSVLARPTFLPFFAAGCVWLIVSLRRGGLGWRNVARCAVNGLVGFVIVAAPVAMVVRRHTGVAAITPYSGSMNVYIGNNPDVCETINARPGWRWTRIVHMPDREGVHDLAGRQRFFSRKVKDYAFNQPLSFIGGMFAKTGRFLSSREMPRNSDIYLFRRWSGILSVLVWKVGGFGFPFGVLLPPAVLGIVLRVRKNPIPVYLYLLLYPLSVILVFVSGRYRVVIVPVLAVVAAGGVVGLYEVIRARRARRLGLGAAILAAVVLLSVLPGPFCEERVDYEAELYSGLGTAYRDRRQLDKAFGYFRKSIELNPKSSDVLNELGNYWFVLAGRDTRKGDALGAAEKLDKAVRRYTLAAEVRPENPKTYQNRGLVSMKRHRPAEAIGYFAESLRLDCANTKVHYLMGLALLLRSRELSRSEADNRADVDRAVEHLSQSLRLDPKQSKAHFRLAEALYRKGKIKQAIGHYKAAVKLRLKLPKMQRQFAWILATEIDSANRNGEAAVNLANKACLGFGRPGAVYLDTLAAAYAEMGRFATAVQVAQRAIDTARLDGQYDLTEQIRARMRLYRARRPYRHPRPEDWDSP